MRSARFAGEQASDAENLDRLRREVPAGSGADLRVRAGLRRPADGEAARCSRAAARARWLSSPAGRGGFGYDPVFLPDDGDAQRTMAELDDSEKDAISHRGRAARSLLAWLAG